MEPLNFGGNFSGQKNNSDKLSLSGDFLDNSEKVLGEVDYSPKIPEVAPLNSMEKLSNPELEKAVSFAKSQDEDVKKDELINQSNETAVRQSYQDQKKSALQSAPATAGDEDLIEKEWVDKAKSVVNETKNDPYRQEKLVSELAREYIMKRYGREIGVTMEE